MALVHLIHRRVCLQKKRCHDRVDWFLRQSALVQIQVESQYCLNPHRNIPHQFFLVLALQIAGMQPKPVHFDSVHFAVHIGIPVRL